MGSSGTVRDVIYAILLHDGRKVRTDTEATVENLAAIGQWGSSRGHAA